MRVLIVHVLFPPVCLMRPTGYSHSHREKTVCLLSELKGPLNSGGGAMGQGRLGSGGVRPVAVMEDIQRIGNTSGT